jgi:hypothetical protein
MKTFARFCAGISVGVGIVVIVSPQSALAQRTSSEAVPDFQSPDRSNPFSGRGDGQASSVLDLIHNAVLAPSKNADEFNTQQQENLNDATARFRARQAELLRQQGQATSQPVIAPAPTIAK